MTILNQQLRSEVIALYSRSVYLPTHNKTRISLVYLGRDYPAGYTNFFRPKLKAAFMKKRDLVDEAEIRKSIAFGNYIIKELEAMYYLKKYRTLRARYTVPEEDAHIALQKALESERI